MHIILEEEWEHHRYAVRDLDAIAAGAGLGLLGPRVVTRAAHDPLQQTSRGEPLPDPAGQKHLSNAPRALLTPPDIPLTPFAAGPDNGK